MLYQLAIGDFRKAISPGWEAGIEDPLIREDIAAAACGDPARRLASAAELAERLLALDRRHAESDQLEQKRKREQIAERRRARLAYPPSLDSHRRRRPVHQSDIESQPLPTALVPKPEADDSGGASISKRRLRSQPRFSPP